MKSLLALSPRSEAPGDFILRPSYSAGQAPARWFGMDAIKVCSFALKTVVSKVGMHIPGGYLRSPSGVQRENTRTSVYDIFFYLILLRFLCCILFIMCLIY